MSNKQVTVTTPNLFYIQDSTLLSLGFKLIEFYEMVLAGEFRHKVFDLSVKQGEVISVSYKYQSVGGGVWQLTSSRIDIIIDGIEVPTHASSLEDLEALYGLLAGRELKRDNSNG